MDILIGGAHYERCIHDRREFFGDVVLRDTVFGWVVVGSQNTMSSGRLHCGVTSVEFDHVIIENSTKNSYYNPEEVDVMKKLVGNLLEIGIDVDQIGVMASYEVQRSHITQKLNTHPSLKISSVDSFQGQERDVIIISCVRSNRRENLGFLTESLVTGIRCWEIGVGKAS